MKLNPRFEISIHIEEGQEEWVEIMKQELKERLIKGKIDYFAVIKDEKENITVSFIPRKYVSQKELIESFEKNVLEPARKAAGLERT
ncbi:hypothetical protein WMO40_20575 [Bacillaceae bacterium CLA-AA-H227]|uniref:Uncharacterized protein n=1 Tax=Robertmurraya yapensis (ex Hitch et al 2024) TaxID=3133160 RepID=A0ACC6SGY3_9BACI